MTGNEYQELAMRTNDGKATDDMMEYADSDEDVWNDDEYYDEGDELDE